MAVLSTMAGRTSAAAYPMEVRQDGCKVRLKANESKHSDSICKRKEVKLCLSSGTPSWSATPWTRSRNTSIKLSSPLEQAKLVATEARKIPNLAGYIDQHLARLIGEIERVTGGVLPWNKQPYVGNVRAAISSVRESLPRGAVEGKKKKLESGSQLSLVE
jgi:hypothetical protein